MTRPLPASASVASRTEGAKLHAPAAARNLEALCDLLRAHAPDTGTALELASGTGQHVVGFATALPGVIWQPTEPDATRRASIDAYAAEAGASNIAPAAHLDATAPGWGAAQHPKNMVLLINLLHLISAPEAQVLLQEAAIALAPGGSLMLYGPFKRDGRLTSDGDARFDADLRASDPDIGYKDVREIETWLQRSGLTAIQTRDMPANNLAFIARRVGP